MQKSPAGDPVAYLTAAPVMRARRRLGRRFGVLSLREKTPDAKKYAPGFLA